METQPKKRLRPVALLFDLVFGLLMIFLFYLILDPSVAVGAPLAFGKGQDLEVLCVPPVSARQLEQ